MDQSFDETFEFDRNSAETLRRDGDNFPEWLEVTQRNGK